MLHRTAWLIALLLLLLGKSAFALSVDPQLIQLVPPQTRLVAGMSSSTAQGKTATFLLITGENKADLNDFFALTGGDASRRIQSVVFVTGAAPDTDANEHSLLASGKFDRDSIFRYGAAGARRQSYRNVPVLVVPPFERERETFRETRWLAVLDGHIAIFGSIGSVQRELDRWIDRSTSDPLLIGRLQRISGHDDSWCVLLARDRDRITEGVLRRLDGKLGEVAHQGGFLAYGIKFGRKIEVVAAAEPFPSKIWNAPSDMPGVTSSAAMHFFSSPSNENAGRRALVKVSRRRYEEWTAQFESRDALLATR